LAQPPYILPLAERRKPPLYRKILAEGKFMEKLFGLRKKGTTVRREIFAAAAA